MPNQGPIRAKPEVAHLFQPIDSCRHPDDLELVLWMPRWRSGGSQPINDKAKLLAPRGAVEEVDFVDDHRADSRERVWTRQLQGIEGLGRDDQAEQVVR